LLGFQNVVSNEGAVQMTDVEITAAEQRIKAAKISSVSFRLCNLKRRRRPSAVRALTCASCLWQANAVSIEGHPNPAFNGLYMHDSTYEGWPVLKNASSMYCYRYTPQDKWLIRSKFKPDEAGARASIVAKEGPLPVGAHTWRIADGKGGWVEGGGTLTVVRPIPMFEILKTNLSHEAVSCPRQQSC
jgi:hypothetical protein